MPEPGNSWPKVLRNCLLAGAGSYLVLRIIQEAGSALF